MTPPELIESAHKSKSGLKRIVNAFFYSLSGLQLAYRHEHAFRQEVALAAILLPIACLVPATAVERVLVMPVGALFVGRVLRHEVGPVPLRVDLAHSGSPVRALLPGR